MKVALITSTKDPASMNIRKWLLDMYAFGEKDGQHLLQMYDHEFRLVTVEKELIAADNIDEGLQADVLIFLSRHVSEAGVPALTVHPIGNFGAAEHGGRPGQLVTSPAFILKELFIKLNELNGLGCEVAMEATHHGPYVTTPALFLEIGSSEEQCKDEDAGRIVATALMSAFAEPFRRYKVAVALGGPHYVPNFSSIAEGQELAVSHVCAKHNLPQLDEGLLRQAMAKSEPKAELVLLDWKGLGLEKHRILGMLNKSGIANQKI